MGYLVKLLSEITAAASQTGSGPSSEDGGDFSGGNLN